ncbi:MAG: LamG domain-containing protein [Candidatus Aminicenantes bacterium]|nr:LamG domain-containing protein [Candidatus Aminicenantes bacterium]
MRILKEQQKWISLFVTFTFMCMLQASTVVPLRAERSVKANGTEVSDSSETTGAVEQPGPAPSVAKKKHFPWLWVILGAVLIAGGVYYYLNYMQKFTLTVNKGEGVVGAPDSGATKYKRGESIDYSYSLESGYHNLVVMLDGAAVAASGSVSMKANHTLAANATQQFVLTVNIDAGVSGAPVSGAYTYDSGQAVSYSYSLKSGFTNLEIKVDGVAALATGTVTMNGDHVLTATTTGPRKLTVTRGAGVSGSPSSGTFSYLDGSVVNYSYTQLLGYYGMVCFLDGTPVVPMGSVTMNADHTLAVSANPGLELEWLFTGNAQDTSGKGRHGTAFNATLTTDYKSVANRAYYFNGTTAYIQGPNFHAHASNQITFSFWVRIPASIAGIKYFFWHNDFYVAQSVTSIAFAITTIGTNNAHCSVSLNTWTHIAGTYDGTNIRIYRNGTLMDTMSHPGTIADQSLNFEIGRHGSYWQGYIDDVRIYRFCMSQSDIAKLAAL